MISIANILKKIVSHLLVLSYTVQDYSKVFKLFSDFLSSSPEGYFESPKQYYEEAKKVWSFKEIPLYLTEKGSSALKEKLSEFPKVIGTGIETEPGFKKKAKPNFLYFLGQFLTIVAVKLDYMEYQDKEIYAKHKEDIEKIFDLWDSKEKMNAYHLFEKYESKNNETARRELKQKLSESAFILSKF
jgi:hypothetical protein